MVRKYLKDLDAALVDSVKERVQNREITKGDAAALLGISKSSFSSLVGLWASGEPIRETGRPRKLLKVSDVNPVVPSTSQPAPQIALNPITSPCVLQNMVKKNIPIIGPVVSQEPEATEDQVCVRCQEHLTELSKENKGHEVTPAQLDEATRAKIGGESNEYGFELDGYHIRDNVLNTNLQRNQNLIHLVDKEGLFYMYAHAKPCKDGKAHYYYCQRCKELKRKRKDLPPLPGLTVFPNGRFRADNGRPHYAECQPKANYMWIAQKHWREAKLMASLHIKSPKKAWTDGCVAAQLEAQRSGLTFRGPGSVAEQFGEWPQSGFWRWGNCNGPEIVDPFDEETGYGDLETNLYGEPWILARSRRHGTVVIATDYNLRMLADAEKLQADGTFRVCPKPFEQYFTISAKVANDKWVPVAAALMNNKLEQSYEFVFEQIIGYCVTNFQKKPAVQKFMTDWEPAMQSAIAKSFGSEKVSSCLFHYSKAIHRHMADCGLSRYYQQHLFGEKNAVWRWIRRLMALPLIPAHLVYAMWHNRLQNPPVAPDGWRAPDNFPWPTDQLNAMAKYVEDNWIQKLTEKGNHFGNVNDRTSNASEGYHASLGGMPRKPGLRRFLECIRENSVLQEQKITMVQARRVQGKPLGHRRRKAYVNNDAILANSFRRMGIDLRILEHTYKESVLMRVQMQCDLLETYLDKMSYTLMRLWRHDRTGTVTVKEGKKRERRGAGRGTAKVAVRKPTVTNILIRARKTKNLAKQKAVHTWKLPYTRLEPPKKKSRTQEPEVCQDPGIVESATLTPVSAPVGRGLRNQSQKCFANSLLQVLTHTKPFNEAILKHDKQATCPPACLACNMRLHFEAAGDVQRRHFPFESALNRDHLLYKIMPGYDSERHQDSPEYFAYLMRYLEEDVNKSNAETCFSITTASTVTCSTCQNVSTSLDASVLLVAPINRDGSPTNIGTCLKRWENIEHLEGDNAYACTICDPTDPKPIQLQPATKKLVLQKLPDVFVMQLGRFVTEGTHGTFLASKLENEVEFKEDIDLGPYTGQKDSGEHQYRLYAILHHTGSLRTGHNTSYVCLNGQWLWFDDIRVTPCTFNTVVGACKRGGYLLFYEKIFEHWNLIGTGVPIPFLTELTREENDIVNLAWAGCIDQEIVANKFGIDVSRKDIKRLSKSEWLNDKIVDFYFKLIFARAKIGCSTNPPVYCFSSYAYRCLERGRNIAKWPTKELEKTDDNILCMDLVFIPIHRLSHWTLAVIHIPSSTVEYYDSFGGPPPGNFMKLMNTLRVQVLWDLSPDEEDSRIAEKPWKLIKCSMVTPNQENSYDCGVFMCQIANFLSLGAPLTFTQQDIPLLRRRMALEILNQKLFIQFQ